MPSPQTGRRCSPPRGAGAGGASVRNARSSSTNIHRAPSSSTPHRRPASPLSAARASCAARSASRTAAGRGAAGGDAGRASCAQPMPSAARSAQPSVSRELGGKRGKRDMGSRPSRRHGGRPVRVWRRGTAPATVRGSGRARLAVGRRPDGAGTGDHPSRDPRRLGLLPGQPSLLGALQVVAHRALGDRARRRDRSVPQAQLVLQSKDFSNLPHHMALRHRPSRAPGGVESRCPLRPSVRRPLRQARRETSSRCSQPAAPSPSTPSLACRQRLRRGCPTPPESVLWSSGTGARVLRNRCPGGSGTRAQVTSELVPGSGRNTHAPLSGPETTPIRVFTKPIRVFTIRSRCSRCSDLGVQRCSDPRVHHPPKPAPAEARCARERRRRVEEAGVTGRR